MLTFGALRKGAESAPGQPTLEALAGLYRLKEQVRARASMPLCPLLFVVARPVATRRRNSRTQRKGDERGWHVRVCAHGERRMRTRPCWE